MRQSPTSSRPVSRFASMGSATRPFGCPSDPSECSDFVGHARTPRPTARYKRRGTLGNKRPNTGHDARAVHRSRLYQRLRLFEDSDGGGSACAATVLCGNLGSRVIGGGKVVGVTRVPTMEVLVGGTRHHQRHCAQFFYPGGTTCTGRRNSRVPCRGIPAAVGLRNVSPPRQIPKGRADHRS